MLTQHRRGAAVLPGINEYEWLVERAGLAEDVRTAELQLAGGGGIDHAVANEKVLMRFRR